MELVAFVTIIFAFAASPQIRATCTKQYGTNNIEMDSCPKDFYGNMPMESNNFQINLEMDSYEMSKRLQIAQYQFDSLMPYKNFQFLSGAYALEPEQDCNQKPIYIYVPIEKASLKNAIDWNEALKVPETSNIDDDDQCLISPPRTTPKIIESSVVDSDHLEEMTSTPRITSLRKTTTTPPESEDLSLCGEKSDEKTSRESEKEKNKKKDKNNVPEKPKTTTKLHPPLGELDSDGNDEVKKKQSKEDSEENITSDERGNNKDSNIDYDKTKKRNPANETNNDNCEPSETIQKPVDGNDEPKKVKLFKDQSGHLFEIVESPESINLDKTPSRQYRIDKNGNLIDTLNNNQIEVRSDDNNNTGRPKRLIRDINGNLINIRTDGNLKKLELNLVDDVSNKKRKVYKIDQNNNLVDIQTLEDFARNHNKDSDESLTPTPPSKFYTDIYSNHIELLQSDIFLMPDYSWSSEDDPMDKPRRKYRLDKNGNLVDIITGEDAGVNWEFIDESKLKPILDKRGNIIIVALNNESIDKNDLVKSKNRRICRLDKNLILIGYYISNRSLPENTKKKRAKKPLSVKPKKEKKRIESDDYSVSKDILKSNEKKVTEETHPDMFKDTDCLSTNDNSSSEDYSESNYADSSDELTDKKVKPKIPREMFVDTNC